MRSKQLAQGTFDRHHAVVIGGSMTGLLAARVLSDHFGKLAEYWDANAGLRASCPNLQPKHDGPQVQTRFPRSDSLQENRSLFKRKEGIQISPCCPAAVAPGAV